MLKSTILRFAMIQEKLIYLHKHKWLTRSFWLSFFSYFITYSVSTPLIGSRQKVFIFEPEKFEISPLHLKILATESVRKT